MRYLLPTSLVFLICLFLANPNAVFSQDKGKTQEVVGEGVGTSADLALKDAFRNAVRQVVGAYVDAETLVKNDELVEDKILTYSNGFIKTFSEIEGSKKVQGGIYRVKIKAVVETGSVIAKLKASNISIKEVDGKGLFAEVVSKMDSEKDASALLKKSFEGFPRSCLKIEVKGEPKLLEKSDTKATVLIQIEVSVDPKAYKAFSSKLQTVLEKLVSEKKSKGEFLIKSEEIILSEGNKYLKSGDIHFKFKEWMPDGSLPDMSLNSSRSVSNTKSIILSLCNHSNDKADNLGFAFYFLDKSFKPILLASAFELLNGKLVLVDESDESIFIDKFKLIEFDKGREMTFEGQMTVTSDWHENGSSSFNRRSNSPGEKFMGESSIFFISPSFFSVDNHDFCYKPTLLINRNIELSLEELKKIKKAKVEISPP
jgi:hypothetical protein